MTEEKPQVYIHLFHGRTDINADMNDWGSIGPEFGPFPYVHTTYNDHLKFGEDSMLRSIDDMIYYDGIYYGDWSVTAWATLGGQTEFDPAKAEPPAKPKEQKPSYDPTESLFALVDGIIDDRLSILREQRDGITGEDENTAGVDANGFEVTTWAVKDLEDQIGHFEHCRASATALIAKYREGKQ